MTFFVKFWKKSLTGLVSYATCLIDYSFPFFSSRSILGRFCALCPNFKSYLIFETVGRFLCLLTFFSTLPSFVHKSAKIAAFIYTFRIKNWKWKLSASFFASIYLAIVQIRKLIVSCAAGAWNYILCAITKFDDQY